MEFIKNLGRPISSKTITIEKLDKGENSYVILGTPKLDRNEIYELMGVLRHEIRYRDAKIHESLTKAR